MNVTRMTQKRLETGIEDQSVELLARVRRGEAEPGLKSLRELFWMVSNRCVFKHQTDRFIYLRSHAGIAGGDIYDKRQTVQVSIHRLWIE